MYLFQILKSHYCKITFLILLTISYFLLPINNISGWHYIPTIIFMFLFAATGTCIIRNIKERIALQHKAKSSILTLISTAIGLSALQVCGLGGPVCGASLGLGILTAILPNTAIKYLMEYHMIFIFFAIALQLLSLYLLKCFSNNSKTCVSKTF